MGEPRRACGGLECQPAQSAIVSGVETVLTASRVLGIAALGRESRGCYPLAAASSSRRRTEAASAQRRDCCKGANMKPQHARWTILAAIATLTASVAAGCSLVESSESISKIVSSPFKSLSKSSSSDSSSPEQAYEDDVSDYTAAYIKSGGDTLKLKAGISEVAEKRGITDWETDGSTYQGLGAGLKRAGVNQPTLDGYKSTMATTDQQRSWMQEGYDSADKDE
jgi:hypothetical protein